MQSGSRPSRCFDKQYEDDDEPGQRDGTSNKEMNVGIDNEIGDDLSALTPRSKHSATEQRRRRKINERFQLLRQLLPNGDQKRDKASFLLEVIEYIQFLQEKVQSYESSYPGWSEENAKLMPWNNGQVPTYAIPDHKVNKNVSDLGYEYSSNGNRGLENPSQANYAYPENGSNIAENESRSISDIDYIASQSQSQWLRPSGSSVGTDMSDEQEELTIDEGTICISTAYSQNTLNALHQALEISGLDLSQSNISVNISLGKRAMKRDATTTLSNAQGFNNPSSQNPQMIANSRGIEIEKAPKRPKLVNS